MTEVLNARPRVARSLADLVGRTPVVQLTLPEIPADVTVLAKLEAANPLGSVKDRAALYMLRGAEERGDLRPGGTVVEASSGNTGISLAALAAAGGYRCVIVLPDSATQERINILTALGAEVVLTPRAQLYAGAIAKAEELHAAIPGSWFPCQHENEDNIRAHYETTGPELWADVGADLDVFVCGVGTGGTLTGTSRYLTERNPAIRVVAVEPEKSPVLSGGAAAPHRIPGYNGGFVAPTTDVHRIDQVVTVSDEDALATARLLARSSGLFVGVSAGAAAYASIRLANLPGYAGKTIATLFPDTGERYLSMWDA